MHVVQLRNTRRLHSMLERSSTTSQRHSTPADLSLDIQSIPASSEMGSSGYEEPSRELSPAPLFSPGKSLRDPMSNAMTCGISHVCSAEEEHDIEPHLILKPGKRGLQKGPASCGLPLPLEPEFPDIALSWSDPIWSGLWVVLRMHRIVPDGIFHHTPCRALQPSNSVTTGFRRMQEMPPPPSPQTEEAIAELIIYRSQTTGSCHAA